MNASFEEPTIPPRLQRPLAAVWISLGLHAALIALVQVAPPAAMSLGEPVIEARLVSTHAAPPVAEPPPSTPEAEVPTKPREKVPPLAPSETAEALPVAKPVPPPVPAETAAAASQPAGPAPAPTESQPAPTESQPAPAESQSAPASAPQPAAKPAPELTMTSSVDLTYYGARDLDVQPHALHKIEPDYPADADRQRLSGKVRLQLKLEADGRVGDIDVVSATPTGLFEDSAIKAFRDARFTPAQKNGRPVRALVQIEVVYDWKGQPR